MFLKENDINLAYAAVNEWLQAHATDYSGTPFLLQMQELKRRLDEEWKLSN